MTTKWTTDNRRMSGLSKSVKPANSLMFRHGQLGQSCPQHYPSQPTDQGPSAGVLWAEDIANALGEPLSIRDVARLIGCSAWTVRQRYLPHGLPYFRSGPTGKLIFYRNQVIAWILQQQLKGGTSK